MNLISKVGIFILVLLTGVFIFFIVNFGPIISGFGSKGVCSCVYLGNRTLESVMDNELGSFPLNLGRFEVNLEDSSATGTVFGLAFSKAIYRKGLGCTLVREKSEEEVRNSLPQLQFEKTNLSDTVYWPIGNKIADTVPAEVDLKKLQEAIKNSFNDISPNYPIKTRAVVVIYKGQLLAEQYAPEFNKESLQLGWSMTKSVTNALYGILVKKGLVDIYQPAPLKAWSDESDSHHKITTDKLLRMSSGLHWEEVYSNVSTATNMLYKYADMGGFAASQPTEFAPDEKWYYSSGTTNILSKILREKLGDEAYYSFAHKELFSKIGANSAIMEVDASGNFVASSYMWATARDWGKLGLLFQRNGNWFGEQIISEDWITYTRTPTSAADMGQYGAQWWLNAGEKGHPENRLLPNVPTDMYMMDGYEGQRVFVVPSKDLVVVRLGQNKKDGFDQDAFLRSIISSIN